MREVVLIEESEFRHNLFESVDGAKSEIQISCYIFEWDDFGQKLFARLKEKANEGALVQLCVDGFGSAAFVRTVENLQLPDNFQMRVFHPLPWPFSKWPNYHFWRLDRLFHWLYYANVRNHQKLFLFDGRNAIIGSRNIHDQALKWRETSLLFDGNTISQAALLFEFLWHRSHQIPLRKTPLDKTAKLRLESRNIFSTQNLKERRRRNHYVEKRINDGMEQIYIATPYFLPQPRILKGLAQKALNGLDVRLLLPRLSDVRLSKWLAQAQYDYLLESGVRIWEYEKAILHQKLIAVDQWALVGSSNFNRRSFLRDIEIDYAPETTQAKEILCQEFLKDLQDSTEITAKNRNLSLFKKALLFFVSIIFYSWF